MNKTKQVSLADLIPHESEIDLLVGGETKRYTLRKYTLADEGWLEKTFGETRQEFLSKLSMTKLGKLVFRLLKVKDEFEAKKVKDFDDNGNRTERLKPGYEQIMESIIGEEHMFKVAQAVIDAMGYSNVIDFGEMGKKKISVQTMDMSP